MSARHGIGEFSHRERLAADRRHALRLLDAAVENADTVSAAVRLARLRAWVLTGPASTERAS